MLEMPFCNTDMFEIFLNELSGQNPDEFKIMFLDNGAFHKAKRLTIPHNIALAFLPPYSPELNPAEQIWKVLKSEMKNKVYANLDALSRCLTRIINKTISTQSIKSITGYDFYLSAFRTIYDL